MHWKPGLGHHVWFDGAHQEQSSKVQRQVCQLRPKLDRLAKKVAELATKCEENANRAEGLKQEVERRRDRWLWFLGNFSLFIGICSGFFGLILGGGIGALGVASLAIGAGVGLSGAVAAVAVGTLFQSVIAGIAGVSAASAAANAATSMTASMAAAASSAVFADSTVAVPLANAYVVLLRAVSASIIVEVVASTALLLALFMLGWLARDRLKSLLGRLWAAEIKAHERCAAGWRRLEQDLKTAAQLLRNSTESCEKLETCLDVMFEGAEHAWGNLEDHKTHPVEGDLAKLTREVDELCSSYELVLPAFEHFQHQVMSLQDNVNNSACLSTLLSDARRPLTHQSNLPIEDDRAPMLENVQADGSSVSRHELQVEPRVEEVTLWPPVEPASIPSLADEGWILVESEPLSTSTVSFSATSQFLSGRQDCIPGKTYLMLPIEVASRFGAFRAAGPSGDRICEVTEEESNQRLMSVLRLGEGEHLLTANHPLRVNRSGVCIQEQASRLRLGDAIVTTMGMEVLSKMPATLLSTEPVYRLDIESTHLEKGEVFICTSVNDNGHKRFSGIAVLSSPEQDNASIRASSAPPLRMSGTSSSDSSGFSDDLPSIGSRLHQEGCCTNVCKKFLRGRCEEAGECRFCHFPHPEESKRAPRGSRNNRGRSGAQSSNLS